MKIALDDLRTRRVQRLVIESVDLSLYIAQVVVDGETCLVVDAAGKPLKTRNLLDMKRHFRGLRIDDAVLHQRSAYDEMVGHSASATDNTLELPISAAALPIADWEH